MTNLSGPASEHQLQNQLSQSQSTTSTTPSPLRPSGSNRAASSSTSSSTSSIPPAHLLPRLRSYIFHGGPSPTRENSCFKIEFGSTWTWPSCNTIIRDRNRGKNARINKVGLARIGYKTSTNWHETSIGIGMN